MALLNYLFPESYTLITNVCYGKSANILRVELTTFKDSTKTVEIGKRTFQFERTWIPNLNGFFITQPPATVNPGDGFLTAISGCTGDWFDRDHTYAVWDGSSWIFWGLGGRDIFYDAVNNRYVHLEADYTLKAIDCFTDSRIWDVWMQFSDPEMNVIKNIYNYIKSSVPSFSNCIDG